MDVAPDIRQGGMFVPIRLIASNFGCEVHWKPSGQIIRIIR